MKALFLVTNGFSKKEESRNIGMADTNLKKIAIMTWYTYINYGSALQASAIYHTVEQMCYIPAFIRYLPKGGVLKRSNRELVGRCIHKFKTMYNPTHSSLKRNRLFEVYLAERTIQTEKCVSYQELHDLNKEYSAFLCGSDQIWSPLCYDSKYFLDFVENPNKIVAYAPSLGSIEIVNPIIRERMKSNISRFKHLSVREHQGADIIKELTGQKAKVVLDPTLLMDSSEWDAYIEENCIRKLSAYDYIICYFLGSSDKYMGYVRNLSRTMHIPYYVIPVTMKQKKSKESVPFEVGPCEFVSLIRNAKYVITDSFHGMAFSVNYNIPFSVFKRFKDNDPKNQNSRIFNLLQMLGLENRLVDYRNKRNVQTELNCDFTEANRKLNEKREYSLDYLKNALESAVLSQAEFQCIPFKITDMCCGCGACASICGKGAISIIRNDEGFEHYSIDQMKCVQCGQCKTVCPMTEISAPDMKESHGLYSVKSHSEQTLKKSSSGGVGHDLASNLLDEEYAVCGCTYDVDTNTAKHIWIMPGEKEKLPLLQGSKYIQSVTADSMKILVNITKERKVAFFGTPCQAAAVDKILGQKGLRDKAIIIDLICHGVPSYHLWNKYLVELDKKYGTGDHPAVLFRSKEREWRRRLLLVDGNGHIYKKEEHKDDFYAFFRRGLCYMESCSDCPYRERSAADLRIGDYWGDKFIKDKQGISMVIAHTDCGDKVLAELSQKQICQVKKQELSEYWSVQYPYNPQRPLIREQLIEELKNENTELHKLRKQYCAYYDQIENIGEIVRLAKKIVKRG